MESLVITVTMKRFATKKKLNYSRISYTAGEQIRLEIQKLRSGQKERKFKNIAEISSTFHALASCVEKID